MNPQIQVAVQKIEGQTFVGANIQLDGAAYVKCTFINCNIIFMGTGFLHIEDNNFDTTCRWTLAGSAAATLSFLKLMYASGATQMVEGFFRVIRGEAPPPHISMEGPPSSVQ
jgi:hypothetical protein